MRVSIVIPVFNLADYLAQAIESAQAQTHPETDVVVVNDGSSDESLAIATRYDVTIVDQANKGVAGARNAGVMNCTGEALVFLDADDWIEPTYVAETIALLQDPAVGIATTDWMTFGLDHQAMVTKAPTLLQQMTANYLPSCCMVRRSAFELAGGYNPRVPIYEDWNLWIELMKHGWSVGVVHQPLFHYRTREHSMVAGSAGRHAELHGRIKDLHPELWSTTQ